MPRSVFRNYLETLFAITLLLAATSSSAGPVESAQPTIDDALIYEIVTHARPVLLITQLTNNNHILVIIGSTHHRILLDLNDLHVFEQPLDNLGHDCIHLRPSTPFLTRWPTVTGRYMAMFAVPDNTGDNIVLKNRDQAYAYALRLSTGTLEALPKLDGNSAIEGLERSWSFSSTKPVHYFYVFNYIPSRWVPQYFNSATLDQATDVLYKKSYYYICDLGPTSSGQRIRVSVVKCQMPTKWNITAGFINATSVVLVDKINAVLIFDRSVLTSGQPTDVVNIPADKFWVKWVPPREPSNKTRVLSTEKPAGTESTKPTTVSLPSAAKWPVVLVLAIAVPNLLLVLGLAGLCIYCICKPKQPSDKSEVLAKPPKAVGGPRNQQDHKSAARTTRKDTKQKHGSSAVNLKTKAARSSTGAKKATASRSSHQSGKSAIASKVASKVGKTPKSSAPGKSATSVSKASKNANASTSKRLLAGPSAPSPGTPSDIFPHPPLPFV